MFPESLERSTGGGGWDTAPALRAVAEPLGKIDKVVMIDNGGNGNGHSPINRFAQTGPSLIFSLLQQMQALGLNIPEVMAQLGLPASSQQTTVTSEEKKDLPA